MFPISSLSFSPYILQLENFIEIASLQCLLLLVYFETLLVSNAIGVDEIHLLQLLVIVIFPSLCILLAAAKFLPILYCQNLDEPAGKERTNIKEQRRSSIFAPIQNQTTINKQQQFNYNNNNTHNNSNGNGNAAEEQERKYEEANGTPLIPVPSLSPPYSYSHQQIPNEEQNQLNAVELAILKQAEQIQTEQIESDSGQTFSIPIEASSGNFH